MENAVVISDRLRSRRRKKGDGGIIDDNTPIVCFDWLKMAVYVRNRRFARFWNHVDSGRCCVICDGSDVNMM